jgi:hypothetical protein
MKNKIIFFILLAGTALALYAQDFGFESDEDAGKEASGSSVAVKVNGEAAVEFSPYIHDFDKQTISFWDMVSGKLNFRVTGANVEAYAAFNLNSDAISELWEEDTRLGELNYTPLIIDEAFLRGYIGPVTIEAGLRKLTWGKADSLGPLDVINPLDYTDLRNLTDIQAIKIARPLFHVSWDMDGFSKIEGVFIPNFTGHRFAEEGRWAPAQYANMRGVVDAEIFGRLAPLMALIPPQNALVVQNMYSQMAGSFSPEFPDTSTLEYFQAGLRFTTTVGPADIGAQYFYGNLFRPDFSVAGIDDFLVELVNKNMPLLMGTSPIDPNDIYIGDINKISQLKYNRYHQFGLDYAQVLFTLNVRAEVALHLTEDRQGDDGSVRNPFIGWSLGFDRDLFWGINANIQCNETIRLFNNKVGDNPVLDCEAGTDATVTRLTLRISKKFFRDELESKVTCIWGVEDSDGYIIPALIWTVGNMSTELSAGFFTGKESGELGQYWENSFVRAGIKFSF